MPYCPQCGEELGPDDPAGLCPKCLILGAFDSSIGAEQSRTKTTELATAGDDDFGRYQILRPLGEGGMGTVYLAEQREPIRCRVALKVVKLGMDTGQVLARFANERQALAMMDHPNIARIFDAGATPKGRPYFVMEYIEGSPITQYCDHNRIAIGQRLGLFLAAGRLGAFRRRAAHLSFDSIGPHFLGNAQSAILRLGLQRELHDWQRFGHAQSARSALTDCWHGRRGAFLRALQCAARHLHFALF